ncbi:MAG: porin, partial [Bacteroidales bacterium]|nr:porin [Bacteroidales bacterium]
APDMPRFAIIGKERKFYLGIGGYAKASISYDFANPITNPLCFVTSSIPMEEIPGNGTLVQMNAGASNLFFNFIALPHTKNQIGAYINFDFSGNNANYGFSLKSAYLTYKGFTLGFKPSLFTDGAACAPTVDQQGPNAMTFLFNTVLNYQYAFNNHWKVGIGLEMPVVNATYNNYSYQVNQRVPDIPFYGQFSYKEGTAWIRLSGLIRNMYYRNVSEGSTEDVFGYGIKLSGSTPLGRKVKLYYQTVYGKGLGSYIQDLQGLGLDMVPAGYGTSGTSGTSGFGGLDNSLKLGTLESVEALGSYTGLMWQISPKFYTSATFSEVECFYPKAAAGTVTKKMQPDSTYKRSKYFVANLFYNITPSVQAGLEYLWGSRENTDGTTHHDTRLQTAVRVNF